MTKKECAHRHFDYSFCMKILHAFPLAFPEVNIFLATTNNAKTIRSIKQKIMTLFLGGKY